MAPLDGDFDGDEVKTRERQPPAESALAKMAKKPKKPKSKLRLALKILGTLLLIPIVLVGAVLIYLHTDAGKTKVRAIITERLNERVNGSVEIGGLDYALFGTLDLREVTIKDAQGADAIHLGHLFVAPNWGDILRGTLAIDELRLEGLALAISRDDAGASNLSKLFKPSDPPPAEAPKKRRHIVVRKLAISDVDVDSSRPDGTLLSLHDIVIEGNVDTVPLEKSAKIELTKIGLDLSLEKKTPKLSVALRGLSTGLSVDLDHGTGKAQLSPLTANLTLALPDRQPREYPIALAGFSVDLGEGDLGVAIDRIAMGVVGLASVRLKGSLKDGALDGPPGADIVGLTIDADDLNALLGKNVLLGDVDVEAHVSGSASETLIGAKVTTTGGTVALSGTANLQSADDPGYDLKLEVRDLDAAKLLGDGVAAPPATVSSLDVTLKGRGRALDTANADVSLSLTGGAVRGIPIEELKLSGHVENGKVSLKSLDLHTLDLNLHADGEILPTTKEIDVALKLDVDAGDLLAKLKAAGLKITTQLPKGAVVIRDGGLTVKAKGALDDRLEVTVGGTGIDVFGGKLKLEGEGSLDRKLGIPIIKFDLDVIIANLRLSRLLAMRGKRLPEGVDGVINGKLRAHGTPNQPEIDLALGVKELRVDGGPTLLASLDGRVRPTVADIGLRLEGSATEGRILALAAKIPLDLESEKKGIAWFAPLSVKLDVGERKVTELLAYIPASALADKPISPAVRALSIDASLAVTGSPANPRGAIHVGAFGALVPSAVTRVAIDGVISPPVTQGVGPELGVTIRGFADEKVQAPALDAKLEAKVPRPLYAGGLAALTWKLGADIGPLHFATLGLLPRRLRMLDADVAGRIDASGNRRDIEATVSLDAKHLDVTKQGKPSGRIDVALRAKLGSEKTTLTLDADLDRVALVRGKGDIGLAGKGFLARPKDSVLDPSLDIGLVVSDRPLASLGVLRDKLQKAPGTLGGKIAITGSTKTPLARADLGVRDVKMIDGHIGGLALAIDAGRDALALDLGLGEPSAETSPIKLHVEVPRKELLELSKGTSATIVGTLRGAHVPLARIVPEAVRENTTIPIVGEFDSTVALEATLAKKEGVVSLTDGSALGHLVVSASALPVPNSKRVWKDVRLDLALTKEAIVLETLQIKESDREVKDRLFTVKAKAPWTNLKPTNVEIDLAAHKFLVFGRKTIGLADAPRGVLDLGAHASVALSPAATTVELNVSKLDVRFPDRFDKAHQPEDVHVGDLAYLGDENVTLGKFAVPEKVAAAAKAERELRERTEAEAEENAKWGKPEPEPIDPNAPAPIEKATHATIRVAKGAFVMQSPIELLPEGEIVIDARGGVTSIRGALTMNGGQLSLGGKMHTLTKGSLSFDEKNPGGFLDLYFAKRLPPWALRNVSEASGGEDIAIHMFGPLSDRKTVLGGAAPGALFDLLAMHNEGKDRFVTEGDLPETVAVDFPQHQGLLMLSFMAVNLPHLLFLDRVAAWSDAYEGGGRYTEVRHYEGERFALDDKLRVKATMRPPAVGTSEADIEVDWVPVLTPRTMLGVGIVGGSRGGGGPGVTFEWSSKD